VSAEQEPNGDTPEQQRPARLRAVLGELGSVVSQTFDRMEIAEEEIRAANVARGRSPGDKDSRVHRSFRILCPPECMLGKSSEVYRAHARELLGRVATRKDTQPGTLAECLCAVLDMSLKAPLTSSYGAVAEKLWAACGMPVIDGEGPREAWPGESDEIIAALRRKLADPGRTM